MNPVAALDAFLRARQLDAPGITGLVLALSGGPDSTALLLAAAELAPSLPYSLRAVHIHHGLHAQADAWAAHAMEQARAMSIAACVIPVTIDLTQASIEGAARQARYDALLTNCAANEALLLAHHQDDQAETLLLQLMRGAGLQGLAAMRGQSLWRTLAGTQRERWRPWLGVSRLQLEQYLNAATLTSIQDPANYDPRFARTHLRHDILPRLQQHWPDASAQLAQSAGHLAQQALALDTLSDAALAPLLAENPRCLMISGLLAHTEAVRQTLIARWLARCGAPVLPRRYWLRLHTELVQARPDAQPQLAWSAWSLRRYRERLYLLREDELQSLPEGVAWPDVQQPMRWAGHWWRIETLCPELDKASAAHTRRWRLAARQGGERYRPAAGLPSKRVKQWCQEQNIPPWQRDRVVCLWADDEVVALSLLVDAIE